MCPNRFCRQKKGLRHGRLLLRALSGIGFFLCVAVSARAQSARTEIDLNSDWQTIAGNDQRPLAPAFQPVVDESGWTRVNVPHNWDDYFGYRRLLHGNKHGDAWYRKKFTLNQDPKSRRFFLHFEGVGSYATVYLNGQKVGAHAGGRTTFTIDITGQILTDGSENILAVRAWHPPFIKDLPWVCGGCSEERGFSEGSQPMGIFRPVHLVITRELRITPYGVHAWATVTKEAASLNINTTLRNYAKSLQKFTMVHRLMDARGNTVQTITLEKTLAAGAQDEFEVKGLNVGKVRLWSTKDPYLYQIVTEITQGKKLIDRQQTDFGFRTIAWRSPTHQFLLNGEPVFINGVAGYEHILGQSHAFSASQVAARVKWIQAAGFNAFRDAHQPHNLRYGKLFNQKGILWWTQLSAHIWYDSPEFRSNFKKLLKEWVIERRNDPSVVMWGLQNESKLPEDFARECTELIRSLDPTASSQRIVTTCNGGEGTDWNVPQNWTGTYGGDPDTYGQDLKKQLLVGEYGAWRSLDLHTEGGFDPEGPVSEDRFAALMEKKVRLAESVKDSVAGHFFWLLSSHDNPGRVQGGEGLREPDRVGPVNYKGMLTPWEEPTDVYYMFRSNYVPADRDPMVYIASHTWPHRWLRPGIKDGIIVYSNCEEVELFNDLGHRSLGKRKKQGVGTHFQWDQADIRYNILYAVGYLNGKAVARDTLTLFHLPEAPDFKHLSDHSENITKAQTGMNYVYRLNCGGGDYRDVNGNLWRADKMLPGSVAVPDRFDISDTLQTSVSWSNAFAELPAAFASQRRIFTPVRGTRDWKLFQTFRYGKHKLKFRFPLPNGDYLVELYFVESWIGVGGEADGAGRRIFDIAFNGVTVIKDLDIWKTVGTNQALKKTIPVRIRNQMLEIDFPRTAAGQALISAIAIATKDPALRGRPSAPDVAAMEPRDSGIKLQSWMDIGEKVFSDRDVRFHQLPPELFGAQWIQRSRENSGNLDFVTPWGADLYVAVDSTQKLPSQIREFESTGSWIITDAQGGRKYQVYKKRFEPGHNFHYTDTRDWLVALKFRTNMQPAYDLKPSTAYNADVSLMSKGVVKRQISGRARNMVVGDSAIRISWPVSTGVADIYAITLKYYSPHKESLAGEIALMDAAHNEMMQEPVSFKFTREGKWNLITVHTSGMINAGHYEVVVRTREAAGLIISNIEIQ